VPSRFRRATIAFYENDCLLTGIHQDHLVPKILAQQLKPATVVFAPEAAAAALSGATVIHNGETKHFGQWTIEALPMYNMKRGPQPGRFYHKRAAATAMS